MEFQEKILNLAQKYNLNHYYQVFEHCFGGNWTAFTYSLYNDSGCFTIEHLPQRGEVSCYFAPHFSYNREELCRKEINIFELEHDIWTRRERFWIFKNPFFYWNTKKVLETILEVVESSIKKNNEFVGIKIKK